MDCRRGELFRDCEFDLEFSCKAFRFRNGFPERRDSLFKNKRRAGVDVEGRIEPCPEAKSSARWEMLPLERVILIEGQDSDGVLF